jgi:hypothetical protein
MFFLSNTHNANWICTSMLETIVGMRPVSSLDAPTFCCVSRPPLLVDQTQPLRNIQKVNKNTSKNRFGNTLLATFAMIFFQNDRIYISTLDMELYIKIRSTSLIRIRSRSGFRWVCRQAASITPNRGSITHTSGPGLGNALLVSFVRRLKLL